jgi:hypothetical protein
VREDVAQVAARAEQRNAVRRETGGGENEGAFPL